MICVHLWFLPSAVRADAWAELSSPDPAVQQAAFAQITKGDSATQHKLKTELETLRKSAWFEAARAAQSARGIFRIFREMPPLEQEGPGPYKNAPAYFIGSHSQWRQAAEKLHNYIFDPHGLYQVPGGDASQWRPGVDVQPGQGEAERLTQEVIQAWNAHHDFLSRQARAEGWLPGVPAAPRTITQPTSQSAGTVAVYAIRDPSAWCLALVDTQPGREGFLVRAAHQYHNAVKRYQRFSRQIFVLGEAVAGSASLKPLPEFDPFAMYLADQAETISTGWHGPGAAGPCSRPVQGLPVEESYLAEVILRSLTALQYPPGEMGGQARHTWRSLQLYRLACGVPPLIWNDKLAKAAADHARDMQRLNYFGHHSPVPGKATLTERAAAAGFYGPVGECLDRGTLGPQGENAVWRWRADAEHHRLLLSEAYSLGAIGTQDGINVLLVGREDALTSQPAASQPSP